METTPNEIINKKVYNIQEELEKLPIEILYSESRKEVGKLSSYIEELEFEISKLRKENSLLLNSTEKDLKEFKKNKEVKILKNNISKLEKTVTILRKDNEELILKNIKLNETNI